MNARTSFGVHVGVINAQIRVAVTGVEPYTADVKLVNYKIEEKLFWPQEVQVSWTQLSPKEIWNIQCFVHGRYPRSNSGSFATGGGGTLEFLAEDETEIEDWPAYVQAAVNAALATVRMP